MITGPIEPATPVVVAQIAIALARSRGGNTFTRIDNVDGMMNAAPTPITARQAMICVVSVACDASRLARKNVARPNCSAPLRPNRSPSAPEVKSNPAKTSEYDATTHCSCDSVAPRSRRERREGHVEGRVAAEDDEQAQAEDAERPPALVVGLLLGVAVGGGGEDRHDPIIMAGTDRYRKLAKDICCQEHFCDRMTT